VSTAAIERYALRTAPTVGPALALAGLTTLLLARLVPDVSGKPLHEDEAVAGLVSARPLGEVLHTVVLDRGGAPLHFVLAHVALALDPSVDALRWLSVVFALATVPLCYDLARRLAGPLAGVTAATLAATSQLLTVYGTFGRMYSLFACASALSADLFVRAVERPGRRTAVVAAAAALLPLAVHPFGAFLFASESAVALWLWRGRDVKSALPVLGVSALALPLLLADLRLSDRYAPEAGQDLDAGSSAGSAGLHALGGAAGGYGAMLAVFVVLAAIGAFALGRRRPAFAAFACVAVAAPPVGLAVADAAGLVSDRLGPRHLVFMLPIWIALVAAGAMRVGEAIPVPRIAVVAAVGVAAALAPTAIAEPRTIATGDASAVAAPAAWLRTHLSPGDVLYPYSPVFLAALPTAAEARGYPREAVALARVAQRTKGVPAVFVSLPLRVPVTSSTVRDLRRTGVDVHAFPSWLILEQRGPFGDGTAALAAAAGLLRRAEPIVAVEAPSAQGYLRQIHGAACAALVRLDSGC
jgi:mannosyltransferase